MTETTRDGRPERHQATGSAALGAAPIHWQVAEGSVPPIEAARACRRRALLLWPRLDRSRLARTHGDPWRIAVLVAQRTPRSLDEIVGMLTRATPACPVVPARSRRPAVAVVRTSHG